MANGKFRIATPAIGEKESASLQQFFRKRLKITII
jgi:hypothetical protein